MRIGILGGTFNPVHNGHLHIAGEAVKKLKLDKVFFVPARIPPHKKIKGIAAAPDRLNMLRLALRGKKKFSILLYEIQRRGKSYSVSTAKYLRRRYGKGARLYFIIGEDSLEGLRQWKDIGELMKIVQFAVFPRSQRSPVKKNKSVLRLRAPKKEISSTGIRNAVRAHVSIKEKVPAGVRKYIETHKLYAT